MTMQEERKLRYKLSLLIGTKPMYVYIEKTEKIDEFKQRVYVMVRGFGYCFIWSGENIEDLRRWTA